MHIVQIKVFLFITAQKLRPKVKFSSKYETKFKVKPSISYKVLIFFLLTLDNIAIFVLPWNILACPTEQ